MEQEFQTPSPEVEVESVSEEGQPKPKRYFRDFFETILLAAALFVLINFVSARIRVDGSSMVPTLQNGEFVFVNRLSYKFSAVQHGDVVVLERFNEDYIKRVIGLPGDHVRIFRGRVYVNEKQVNEPYIAAAPNYNGEWELGEEEMFVLGDNRNRSEDSHNWGPISLDSVIGKAIFVYWPITDWGTIRSYEIVNAVSP